MIPNAFGRTDWSILSDLLRHAQQEGWQVEFREGTVQLWNRRTQPGLIVLPARLVRRAAGQDWQIGWRPGTIELRHARVRQEITLRLA